MKKIFKKIVNLPVLDSRGGQMERLESSDESRRESQNESHDECLPANLVESRDWPMGRFNLCMTGEN